MDRGAQLVLHWCPKPRLLCTPGMNSSSAATSWCNQRGSHGCISVFPAHPCLCNPPAIMHPSVRIQFGTWLYRHQFKEVLQKCTRQMTHLPSSWSSRSFCVWSELQQTTSLTHFKIFSSAKPVLTLPINSPKANRSCGQSKGKVRRKAQIWRARGGKKQNVVFTS